MRLGVLVIALLLGCRAPAPLQSAPHPRVVSLLPNATEILFAMGFGDHVVGVTRYCLHPAEARERPRVGGILDVSTEAVLSLRPDLVIGSPVVLSGRLASLLSTAGARVLTLSFETPASIISGTRAIANALEAPEAGMRLEKSLAMGWKAVSGSLLQDPPLRVLFVAGRNPIVVAGPASFLGALLTEMGAVNVVTAGDVTFPTWSLEQVLRADPDVIVDGSVDTDDDFGAVLAPAGVRAARLHRVVRVPDDGVIRPGPSTADAARALTAAIVLAVGGRP